MEKASNVQPGAAAPATPELDQVNKMLDEMDPEFAKSLDGLKEIAPDANVQIESVSLGTEFDTPEESNPMAEPSKFKAALTRARLLFAAWFRRTRTKAFVFVKTVPKEFAFYLWALTKALGKSLVQLVVLYVNWPRSRKLGLIGILGLVGVLGWMIKANLHGDWLPAVSDPILTNFNNHAQASFDFDPNKNMISFFRAFPQDPEIFLLDKMKVNLKASPGHPLPMGAFEIYVQVDSHDTAIELQNREVEMHDLVQRVIEGCTYNEVVSDLGKNRLKGLIKKEIDHALTQGWVTDIHFKNFILKP